MSPRVIVAIVKSGRMPAAEPVVPERVVTERVVEVDRADPPDAASRRRRPPGRARGAGRGAVPVYVAVGGRSTVAASASALCRGAVAVHSVWKRHVPPRVEPDPPKRAEPVYWGFGGKLRPDAWQDQ